MQTGAVAILGPGDISGGTVSTFGEGSGNIILSDLRCTGNERTLFECLERIRCIHSEDAAVVCQSNGKNLR